MLRSRSRADTGESYVSPQVGHAMITDGSVASPVLPITTPLSLEGGNVPETRNGSRQICMRGPYGPAMGAGDNPARDYNRAHRRSISQVIGLYIWDEHKEAFMRHVAWTAGLAALIAVGASAQDAPTKGKIGEAARFFKVKDAMKAE